MVEDLIAANQACIAQALSMVVRLEGLMKDLRAKNVDLAQRLEKAVLYEDKVRAAKAKTDGAERGKREPEEWAQKAKATLEQLNRELNEIKCQVAALTRWLDYSNKRHRITIEALDASNKEKAELRQRVEA